MSTKKIILKLDLPKPPIYDGKESIISYTRRFNEYIDNLTKNKYDVILKFLNEWLKYYDINLKRLIDFKYIGGSTILSDKKYNKKILKKYSTEYYKYFCIDESSYENQDSDDIGEDDIIIFLKKLLNKIDYMIIKKEKDSNTYYTIIRKCTKE